MLALKECQHKRFSDTESLTYGDGALHFHSLFHHMVYQVLHCFRLFRLVWVVHDHLVEVAIANVTKNA